MLLLDRNKEPSNTVIYISAVIFSLLDKDGGLDYSELLNKVTYGALKKAPNIKTYSLALNFLFLMNKIYIDERGILHVYKQIKNN